MTVLKKSLIILTHSMIGWICCAAIMGIGQALLPKIIAFIIHLIAAPILFFIISAFYYKKFNYTTPVITALIFTLIIMFMDFFVVVLLIMKSMEMFTNGFYSIIGTWIPFSLIFLSTFLTEKLINKGKSVTCCG